MTHIALIAADAPHLKTEQIALRLKARGEISLTIVTVPFQPRPPRSPAFAHRPDQFDSVPLNELAAGLGAEYVKTDNIADFDPTPVDFCLVTGGVLLPEAFLERANGRVLNCHPGLIPECRGLDAFKWAIHDQVPVGNTLHFIDERVDLGMVLCRRNTPVFESDTLEHFASRHYELEIDLLASFMDHVGRTPKDAATLGTLGPSRRRMSRADEERLPAAFEKYKTQFALDREFIE